MTLSKKDFGKGLDMSRGFISDQEAGNFLAGYDFFYYMALCYNSNLYCLLPGEFEIFNRNGYRPLLGNKEFGNRIEEMGERLWHLGKSPLFKISVVGFATKFLFGNKRITKNDNDMKKK